MGAIRVLPPALASQIAAGEVVERPASALKELLENSLDAGASRCDVEITGGGIERLSVRDDGCGMSPEDALLSVERHATSKLKTFEELADVPSFGFRGEALPSIASVSRFSVQSRDEEHDAGTRVLVEGGAAPVVSVVGMAVGTWVEIRELFYNVPARRKFLRSSGTEAGHVAEVLDNAALACPEVTFTLTRDGRKAREWLRAPDRAARVADLFDQEPLAPCSGERGPLTVEAYLSRPERARHGASGLKLFCNQRPIRDRAILHTVTQAYGSVLERGRYPRGVIYLNLPPRLVDINVHPQKSEVRFADPRAVTDAIYQILTEELRSAFSLPATGRSPRVSRELSVEPSGPIVRQSLGEHRSTGPARASSGAPSPRRSYESSTAATRPLSVQDARPALATARDSLSDGNTGLQPNLNPGLQPNFFEPASTQTASSATDKQPSWGKLIFIAQLRTTYLLCEGETGLYVLDQHAAAERVTFDKLRKQYQVSQTASQSLLFPINVEVGAEQCELVDEHQAEMKRLGFALNVLSESTVTVRAIPRLLQTDSPERLVRNLLSELARGGREFSAAVDAALSTMACHGSIRAGDSLGRDEAQALLTALDKVDFSSHCPHGRPIVAFTPWTELERKVGRR
ncbi:MAG: hypothetical protein RJA70_4550 [Pseudomonadota bacterium]|jgi:DNA mismatch repair protein MutL